MPRLTSTTLLISSHRASSCIEAGTPQRIRGRREDVNRAGSQSRPDRRGRGVQWPSNGNGNGAGAGWFRRNEQDSSQCRGASVRVYMEDAPRRGSDIRPDTADAHASIPPQPPSHIPRYRAGRAGDTYRVLQPLLASVIGRCLRFVPEHRPLAQLCPWLRSRAPSRSLLRPVGVRVDVWVS